MFSKMTVPSLSSTRSMKMGSTWSPSLAKVAYAVAISSGVMSFGPSGIEIGRSERSVVTPSASVVSATFDSPTVRPSRRYAQFDDARVCERSVATEPLSGPLKLLASYGFGKPPGFANSQVPMPLI